MARLQSLRDTPNTAREYETIYILRPNTPNEGVAEVNAKIKGVIETMGGKIIKVDNWGKRRLAYEVAKERKGIYLYWLYLAQPGVVDLGRPRADVDVLVDLDGEVADDVVEHAQVALGFLDDAGLRQVEPVQVDALALLGDLVREAALAPVIDLDDLAAHRLDHSLDFGVDLGDAFVRRVGPQDVDRLVFARRVRRVS